MSLSRVALLPAFLISITIGQSRAELPPDAQEAMKKGLQAAKQQEWEIAIQSFQEARKTAPDAPELFYNVGLAESKILGRELRAIAWFGAYLAANPNAPNAAAVNDFIAGLEIKSEGNISRLLKTVQATANQVPTRYEESLGGHGKKWEAQRSSALAEVATLYARSGDINKAAEAAQIAIKAGSPYDLLTMLWTDIDFGIWLGGERGIDNARQLLSMADNSSAKKHASGVYGEIAKQEAKSGNIAGAWRDFNSITTDLGGGSVGKAEVLIAIAKAQFLAGNKEESWKTLLNAKDVINKRGNPSGPGKDVDYGDLVKAQLKCGDSTSAQMTADQIEDRVAHDQASWAIKSTDLYTVESELVRVHDWIGFFDRDLDAPVFLDPESYLKSLPGGDPKKYFDALYQTVRNVISEHLEIHEMLRRQAKQQAKK